MKMKRLFRVVQAVLCFLIAALFIMAAVGIYREGAARKAENPLEAIYTPEAVAEKAARLLPLVFFALGFTAAGLLLGAGDTEKARIPQPGETVKKEQNQHLGVWQTAVCIAAIALIVLGIFNGSALDVLIKAINICSECIGLG